MKLLRNRIVDLPLLRPEMLLRPRESLVYFHVRAKTREEIVCLRFRMNEDPDAFGNAFDFPGKKSAPDKEARFSPLWDAGKGEKEILPNYSTIKRRSVKNLPFDLFCLKGVNNGEKHEKRSIRENKLSKVIYTFCIRRSRRKEYSRYTGRENEEATSHLLGTLLRVTY